MRRIPEVDDGLLEAVLAVKNEGEYTKHFALRHELLWYGVRSAAHVVLMRDAMDRKTGEKPKSLDTFIAQWGLTFDPSFGLETTHRKLVRRGIFTGNDPRHHEDIRLFREMGDRRRQGVDGIFDTASIVEAQSLESMNLERSHLNDDEFLRRGLRYGEMNFASVEEGYAETRDDMNPEAQEVADVVLSHLRQIMKLFGHQADLRARSRRTLTLLDQPT